VSSQEGLALPATEARLTIAVRGLSGPHLPWPLPLPEPVGEPQVVLPRSTTWTDRVILEAPADSAQTQEVCNAAACWSSRRQPEDDRTVVTETLEIPAMVADRVAAARALGEIAARRQPQSRR